MGRLLAAFILVLMAALAGGAALRESVSVDEVAHLGAGVSYLQKFDMRMNIEHPPLAKVMAAFPLVLAGAQVVFVPHYVVTDDGSLSSVWCDARNPYNEKALLCRALENTVYVAGANTAGRDQGAATGIIDPNGKLVASLPYGPPGVVAADIDLRAADGRLARRWAR
jgi:predicted amidohydrolase